MNDGKMRHRCSTTMFIPDSRASIGLFGRAALIAFGAMSGVANSTLPPILPQVEQEFGTSQGNVTVTMVLTILGPGVLIGSLLGGWLSDRFSRRLVMVTSALIYAIAGCGIMFAEMLEHVIAGRLILGIALGAMGAAVFTVIGDYWDETGRNFWSGLVPAVGAMAGMALSVIAGKIADIDWRTSFVVYAVGFVAVALASAGIPGKSGRQSEESMPAATVPRQLLFAILCFGLIVGSIATGTAAYLPHRLVDVGVDRSADRAIAALAGAATVVVIGVLYGRIRRIISLDLAFTLGSISSGIGLVAMALGATPFAVSLGMAIEGLGIGLLMPSLMIYAIERSEGGNRGRLVGLMKGAVFGGPFLVQFVLDPIRLNMGTGPVLAILATSASLLAIYFAARWLRRRRPKIA